MAEKSSPRDGCPPLPRRRFLAAGCVLGTATSLPRRSPAAPVDSRLAVNGGKPVRSDPLRPRHYGPLYFDDQERKELQDVLESRSPFRWWGWPGSPPRKVREFEAEFAAHVGVRHALGVTSGTTALVTAMAALEIGPGDEVILPAWTWYADYDAVVLAGALPVFAEIDESLNIDPEDIERRVTPRTKAVIACHLQGTPCDMDRILGVARKHDLRVLEDSAQCAGGRYHGKAVGSIGDIGINSFQVNKTITAGEGGAVTTSDGTLFERALRFHDVGVLRSPYSGLLEGGALGRFVACNFRMSEFTGAILRAQLRKLDAICAGLRRAASRVRKGIEDLPGIRLRRSPDTSGDLGVAVLIDLGTRERRDGFLRALSAEGVPGTGPSGSAVLPVAPHIRDKVTVHPDWPTFRTPEGRAIRYGADCCPRTLDILGRYGGVALDPRYTDEELQDIVRAIRKVYRALV